MSKELVAIVSGVMAVVGIAIGFWLAGRAYTADGHLEDLFKLYVALVIVTAGTLSLALAIGSFVVPGLR